MILTNQLIQNHEEDFFQIMFASQEFRTLISIHLDPTYVLFELP